MQECRFEFDTDRRNDQQFDFSNNLLINEILGDTLDLASRRSVTSLGGPGERNFNAVSHKPKLTGKD